MFLAGDTLNVSIAYFGPAEGGKTSTLHSLRALAEKHGEASALQSAFAAPDTVSVDEAGEYGLFHWFYWIMPQRLHGYRVRLRLITMGGWAFMDHGRREMLRACDGIVFVLDSQLARTEANAESLENLESLLTERGETLTTRPLAFQLNKRDLPEAMPVDRMRSLFVPAGSFTSWETTSDQRMSDPMKAVLSPCLHAAAKQYELGPK